jgi:hypothetical protein
MSAILPQSGVAGAASSAELAPTASADEKPKTIPGAVEKLALSRERLRAAMVPAPSKPHAATAAHGIAAVGTQLADKVRAMPGATVVVDAVRDWWGHHPLNTAGILANEAARKYMAGPSNRKPLTLVFAAVVAGALLAVIKPWRLLLRPALLAGLIPALATRAVREVPIDSLMRMYSSLTKSRRAKSPASRATSRSDAPLSSAPLRTAAPMESTGVTSVRPGSTAATSTPTSARAASTSMQP